MTYVCGATSPSCWVIAIEPVGLVDDSDDVGVGEFGRKLSAGTSTPGDVRWPTAGGPSSERSFLPVPMEGVDPFPRPRWAEEPVGCQQSACL
jgi:hypothetical protein